MPDASPQTPQLGDTVTLASRLMFDSDTPREGKVVAVADDGRVTAEFLQPGYPPMRITSDADYFTVVRQAPAPVGFIVLLHEHGQWHDNWDGTVHPTEEAGNQALSEARNAGYTAVLTAAVPVGPLPDDLDVSAAAEEAQHG